MIAQEPNLIDAAETAYRSARYARAVAASARETRVQIATGRHSALRVLEAARELAVSAPPSGRWTGHPSAAQPTRMRGDSVTTWIGADFARAGAAHYAGLRGPARGDGRYSGVLIGGSGLGGTGWGSDVAGEIAQIDPQMIGLDRQMFSQLPDTTIDPRFSFYHAVWLPFFAGWKDFVEAKTSVLGKTMRLMSPYAVKVTYDDLQEFRGKLQGMWLAASVAGFHLQGPEPDAPRTSIISDGEKKIEDWLGGVWSVLKVILYLGIGIAGLATLYTVYKNLHGTISAHTATHVATGGV